MAVPVDEVLRITARHDAVAILWWDSPVERSECQFVQERSVRPVLVQQVGHDEHLCPVCSLVSVLDWCCVRPLVEHLE